MEFSQKTMSLLFDKLNYETLPQHILASMVNDLKKQLISETDLYWDTKNKLEKIIREKEKSISDKDNKIIELERNILAHKEEIKEDIDELVKMTTKKKKNKCNSRKTKEDEENNQDSSVENHKLIFDNFVEDCCKWSPKRMKSKCTDTNRYYEIAAGSTELLYKSFKDWAVASDLIISKAKSNLIPSKEKFKRLCVEGHKSEFPNDWCQKRLKFPLSPNGSFNTPRVNLHLVKDPVTKEELFKK